MQGRGGVSMGGLAILGGCGCCVLELVMRVGRRPYGHSCPLRSGAWPVAHAHLQGVKVAVDQIDVAARRDRINRLLDLLAHGDAEHLGAVSVAKVPAVVSPPRFTSPRILQSTCARRLHL